MKTLLPKKKTYLSVSDTTVSPPLNTSTDTTSKFRHQWKIRRDPNEQGTLVVIEIHENHNLRYQTRSLSTSLFPYEFVLFQKEISLRNAGVEQHVQHAHCEHTEQKYRIRFRHELTYIITVTIVRTHRFGHHLNRLFHEYRRSHRALDEASILISSGRDDRVVQYHEFVRSRRVCRQVREYIPWYLFEPRAS